MMTDSHLQNSENESNPNAETEPQFRSIMDPIEIRLPKVKSILHEMEEKGIRLPKGLTKRIEDIPDENENQRFTVLNQIGQGGMSHVYRVFDRDIGRTIAVKAIKLDKSSPVNFKRALNEMQITGQLEHPNIMPLHDVGIDENNNIYFTMKLINGEDLGSILENLRKNKRYKGFNRQRLLEIFVKVCDAVSFAHSRDVIHRDLKPHNIMVGEFGEVLLTDWGIAKIVKHKQPSRKFRKSKVRLPAMIQEPGEDVLNTQSEMSENDTEDDYFGTKHGSVAGTPAFMPPEQALGDIKNIDARSDIYSLGGILYHILTYFPPFVGSLPEIIEKVVKGDIRKPTNINPEIPKELEIIALKAMSHHKANRHHTVKELKEEVQAFLENRPIDRITYTFYDLFRKFWSRNKVIFIWAFITALITGFIVFFVMKSHYDSRILSNDEIVKKLSEAEVTGNIGFETNLQEVLELGRKLQNIEGEIQSLDETLNSFKDVNVLGLPRTGYYWQIKFKKQVFEHDRFRTYQQLIGFSRFIRNNFRGNIQLAELDNKIGDIREKYKTDPSVQKWEQENQLETKRVLNSAKKLPTKASFVLEIEKSNKTPIIDADIHLFQMVDGGKHGLVSRMIPRPYKYNERLNEFRFSPEMLYSSLPELFDYWQMGNSGINKIKQNSSVSLDPGSYVISISTAFLERPVMLGFEIKDFNAYNFKIILPDLNQDIDGFCMIPGVYFGKEKKNESYTSFYIAQTQVTFGNYLKFLNSQDNHRKLFDNPDKLIPRKNDNSKLVGFDDKNDKNILLKGISEDQPVTGISYLDVVEYLRWLNENTKLSGQFRLISLSQYKRMNPFGWQNIWGNQNDKYFRLGKKKEHYFADTDIFGVRGLNTGIQELIIDTKKAQVLSTLSDERNGFSELIPITQSSHFENTGFRLVFIED